MNTKATYKPNLVGTEFDKVSADYAANIADQCYQALKHKKSFYNEAIFITPEVLAASMIIAYQEVDKHNGLR